MGLFQSYALILGLMVLATPLLACFLCFAYVKMSRENLRTERWVRFRQLSRALIPVCVAVWWALWTYASGDELSGDLSFLFWLLPLASVVLLLLLSGIFSRTIFQTKWKTTDILRMTFWRTVELQIPLLLMAASFDALVAGK